MKASKFQCVDGVRYSIGVGSQEAGYFLPLASRAVEESVALPLPEKSPLLLAMGECAAKNGLVVHELSYGNLKPEYAPNISGREPPKDEADWVPDDGLFDVYTTTERRRDGGKEMKDVTVWWAQSPEGTHYEVLTTRASAFRMKMILTPDETLKEPGSGTDFCLDADGEAVDAADGVPEYAACLRLGFRPADHIYDTSMKPREMCVCVEFGEIRSADFMCWVRLLQSMAPQCPSFASMRSTSRTTHIACGYRTNMAPAPARNPPYPRRTPHHTVLVAI